MSVQAVASETQGGVGVLRLLLLWNSLSLLAFVLATSPGPTIPHSYQSFTILATVDRQPTSLGFLILKHGNGGLMPILAASTAAIRTIQICKTLIKLMICCCTPRRTSSSLVSKPKTQKVIFRQRGGPVLYLIGIKMVGNVAEMCTMSQWQLLTQTFCR